VEQSLPSVPQITAFTASEQTAVSQLAGAYCSELVTNPAYQQQFTALFGSTLESSLGSSSASFFGTSGTNANQNLVITPLVNSLAVGTTVDPTYATALETELSALLDRIPSLSSSATVATATQAACQAALGSAALTLK
jgi:hypothetical protein